MAGASSGRLILSLKDNLALVNGSKPTKKPRKRRSKVISKKAVTDELFAHALIRNSMNATAAYRELHPKCSDKTASVEGHKNLAKPSVIAELTPLLEDLFIDAGIETEYVFRRWLEFASATPLDYFRVDDEGYFRMIPTDNLTPAMRTNLRELKVTTTKSNDGERLHQTVTLKVVDQQKAVDTIGKHLGLLIEKLAEEDIERIGDLIERGVKRIKATKDLDGWKQVILDVEATEVK